ncbi:hypothetical protein HOY82DRAFT_542138 [Tuber indicum]|nr:hypothetical protein HOY82DRAFT_542138 [Tuber indicum]
MQQSEKKFKELAGEVKGFVGTMSDKLDRMMTMREQERMEEMVRRRERNTEEVKCRRGGKKEKRVRVGEVDLSWLGDFPDFGSEVDIDVDMEWMAELGEKIVMGLQQEGGAQGSSSGLVKEKGKG